MQGIVLGLLVGGEDRIKGCLRFTLNIGDLSAIGSQLGGRGIDRWSGIRLDGGRQSGASRLDLRLDGRESRLFVRENGGRLSLLSGGQVQNLRQTGDDIRRTWRSSRTLSERGSS